MIYVIMFAYILISFLTTQVNSKEFIPYGSPGGHLLQVLRQNPVSTVGAKSNFADTGSESDNAPQINPYISNGNQQSLRPGNVIFPSILGEQHTLDRPEHPLVQPHVDAMFFSKPTSEQHFLTRPHSIVSTSSGPQFLPHLVNSSPVNSKYDEFHSSIDRPQIIVNAENIYIGNRGFEHLSLQRNSNTDLAQLSPARHSSIPLKMPFIYQWLAAKSPNLTARPSISDSAEIVTQKFNLNPILAHINSENSIGSTGAVSFAHSPLYLRVDTLDTKCLSAECKPIALKTLGEKILCL